MGYMTQQLYFQSYAQEKYAHSSPKGMHVNDHTSTSYNAQIGNKFPFD